MGFTSEQPGVWSTGIKIQRLDGEGKDDEIEIKVTLMWLLMDTSAGLAFYQWIYVDFG